MAIPPRLPPRLPARAGEKHKNESVPPPLRHMYGRLAIAVVLLAVYIALVGFPIRWVVSGAPFLTALLLVGAAKGYKVPTIVPVSVNLAYSISATSWLLYWVFTSVCYPVVLILGVYQLDFLATLVRRGFRKILRELHFTADKIAFFDLPALEINTEVDGLMVLRGVTLFLSSLTIVVHGVEVGIKLSDDLELAIHVDTVTVRFFRTIEIGDVYANLKGGEYEMTFGHLGESTDDADGTALMDTDTPLLKAAAAANDVTLDGKISMTDRLTNKVDGSAPKPTSAEAGFKSITQLKPDEGQALERYKEKIEEIAFTSKIRECTDRVKKRVQSVSSDGTEGFDYRNEKDLRAAVCSELHDSPSVPHPPRRSVKVTTLQNLSPPWQRRFMHRLPLLLRLLLNPLSYLHDIKIASLTAAGSGKWIQYMLGQHVFQQYGENDAEIRRLEARVSSWLSDANFAVQFCSIHALAHVPVLTQYNIITQIRFDDVMAYRTLPKAIDLKQVVRIAGADAEFSIPSFLLPHHEHLLPPIPSTEDERAAEQDVEQADGRPNEVHAENALKQTRKDETNLKMSARVRLPAVCDQELLDWIAALVKATKVIEMEKDPSPLDDARGFKEFSKALHLTVKDSMKRVAVDAVANDKWIAKLVGKVTRKLETLRGDIGYSGDIPIALKPYRDVAEDATKLLP